MKDTRIKLDVHLSSTYKLTCRRCLKVLIRIRALGGATNCGYPPCKPTVLMNLINISRHVWSWNLHNVVAAGDTHVLIYPSTHEKRLSSTLRHFIRSNHVCTWQTELNKAESPKLCSCCRRRCGNFLRLQKQTFRHWWSSAIGAVT